MEIREARIEDAASIVQVMQDAEASGYMLFAPGERQMTVQEMQTFVEKMPKLTSSAFIVANNPDVIGYMMIKGERLMRTSHRASIAIGVHSKSRGQGVGQALITYAIEWAKQKGLHRLELTVIAHNERAIHLYEKLGFEVEGVKRDALYIDGAFVDELYMSKLL